MAVAVLQPFVLPCAPPCVGRGELRRPDNYAPQGVFGVKFFINGRCVCAEGGVCRK